MIQQIINLSDTILSKINLESKAQKKFLVCLFSTWLLIQGRHNIRNTNRYLDYSESTISHWMGISIDFSSFHQNTIEEVISDRSSDWILCGDCSFIPKSGKRTYGGGLFWNGCASKQQKGLEISGFALVNVVTKEAYMVDVCQTPGELKDAEGEAKDYTRIDFYLEHLEQVSKRYSWIKYVALDGYYAKKKVFKYFDTKDNLFLISKLRKDSDLLFLLDRNQSHDVHGNKKYSDKFKHKDPMSQKDKWFYKGQLKNEPNISLYQANMYSPNLKRILNVVLCWNEKLKKHILLFSTDLELEAQELVLYYKRGFQIEFLFRDAKQFSGLTHAQVRDKKKLDFHFNCSFAVVNMGRIIAKKSKKPDDDKSFTDFSFNNAKRLGYNDLLLNKFISNLGLNPKLPEIQNALKKTIEFGVMRA